MVNHAGILDNFLSYLFELKGRHRLRCEYLQMRDYFTSTADCWREQEDKLLEEIEKGTGEGW
ncbi:MAG: hypothetical protein PHS89_00700 [Syntrophaceticus schinkii]|jgi:hypothetical protein|nr:hypothetical protein [Syntrophaceticus schinkii]MDD4260695.1 hypothetical protein [Syntrophaceticus schinkii]MDD4674374.1 hypothetical protein [Syntrophaceticus schinkii]